MDQLGTILDESETLIWVKLFASLDVNKVLFDVCCPFS